MKKTLLIVMLLALGLALAACGGAAEEGLQGKTGDEAMQAGYGRVTRNDDGSLDVVDLIGRETLLPADPQRIAAMTGPSYEMVFMLGGADRLIMTKSGHTTNYPLANLTNPDLEKLETVAANPSSAVNIEEYLSRGVDMVIYYENDTELKKFANVGVPAIVLTLNTGLLGTLEEVQAQSLDEYIFNSTIAVNTLAAILGGEALDEAAAWTQYCTDKLTMLAERTASLSAEERPTIYWGNTWGENVLASYALKNRWYEIMLVGGELLGPATSGGNFPEITREQLFDWDPDIIFVDNHGNYPELVIKDMYKEGGEWATLSAVKNQQLHRIPTGVFFIDKGTTTTLMLLWMATLVQPELFSDIDIIAELQYYYQEFYEYDLSAEEAQRILDGWYTQSEDSAW